MAAGVSLEILDLRHFAAPVLRPVLDAEGELWSKRLHWDYRSSARLLMQYLDNHLLPGYAALEAGQVTGYTFCVYEETKAVIGDVFAMPGRNPEAADSDPEPEREIEATLLKHLFETLLNSPNVDRIESQLLLQRPEEFHAAVGRLAIDHRHRQTAVAQCAHQSKCGELPGTAVDDDDFSCRRRHGVARYQLAAVRAESRAPSPTRIEIIAQNSLALLRNRKSSVRFFTRNPASRHSPTTPRNARTSSRART